MPRTPVQALAFLLGFWIALALSPFGARADSGEAGAYGALEASLYRSVNAVRAERHLIPLERRPELDAVARAHSLDMVTRHYFAHENPEGENALDRLQRARVSGFSLAAENLGITDEAAPTREILNAWVASEVHRRNLYAPPFNATGIGVARAPNGALVFTQLYVTYPR